MVYSALDGLLLGCGVAVTAGGVVLPAPAIDRARVSAAVMMARRSVNLSRQLCREDGGDADGRAGKPMCDGVLTSFHVGTSDQGPVGGSGSGADRDVGVISCIERG